jgi:hypothetical protein
MEGNYYASFGRVISGLQVSDFGLVMAFGVGGIGGRVLTLTMMGFLEELRPF